MSGTKTAEVLVLTAEVRVLMVGSRQVTLSVFGQLDEVPYARVRVMGRVRPKSDYDWVIGANDVGDLVRARFWPPLRRNALTDEERAHIPALAEWLVCPVVRLFCPVDRSHPHQTWDSDGRAEEELGLLRYRDTEGERLDSEARATIEAFKALPLIILAGLR